MARTGQADAELTAPGTPTIQVLDRSITLLRRIAESHQPLNANELAQLCDLNRTTAWRILSTLELHGLVERDPFTQRYSISLELGRLAASADSGRLLQSSRAALESLADSTGEQVSLGTPTTFGFNYIDHVQPRSPRQVPRWLGPSGPLHATASGKVFLSFLPARERAALLQDPLEKFTPKTVDSAAKLESQLQHIAGDGFATCHGEHDILTSAVCAPVTDTSGRLVAVVDLCGPSQRLSSRRLKEIGPEVRDTADTIASRLSPPSERP